MSENNGVATIESPAAVVVAAPKPAAKPAAKKPTPRPAVAKATAGKGKEKPAPAAKPAAAEAKPAKKPGDLTGVEKAVLAALSKKKVLGLGRKALGELGAASKVLGSCWKEGGGVQGGGLMGRGLIKGQILEEANPTTGDRLWFTITAKGEAALAKAE